VQCRPSRPQARHHRGAVRILVESAERHGRLGNALQHGPVGHAPQRHGALRGRGTREPSGLPGRRVDGVGGALLLQRGQQVHGDEVGELRHRHVRQLLRRPCHVQGAADAPAGLGDQLQAFAGPELLGDVLRRERDTSHAPVPVPQRCQHDRPGVLAVLAGRPQIVLAVARLTGLQHPQHVPLGQLTGLAVGDLPHPQPQHLPLGEGHGQLHRLVGPPQPQPGVVQRLRTAGGLPETQGHQGVVGRQRLLSGQRGEQQPCAASRGRRPVVGQHEDLDAVAVPVPECEPAVPSRQPGEVGKVSHGGFLGEQHGRRAAHDLRGRVTEQLPGALVPAGHGALLGHGDPRGERLTDDVLDAARSLVAGGRLLHRHSSRSRRVLRRVEALAALGRAPRPPPGTRRETSRSSRFHSIPQFRGVSHRMPGTGGHRRAGARCGLPLGEGPRSGCRRSGCRRRGRRLGRPSVGVTAPRRRTGVATLRPERGNIYGGEVRIKRGPRGIFLVRPAERNYSPGASDHAMLVSASVAVVVLPEGFPTG
jgi:hypothetical protein